MIELLKTIHKPRVNHLENINKKFGRLLVLDVIKFSRYYKYKYLCDCGVITETYAQGILNNTVSSCGCLHREIIKKPKIFPRKDIRTGKDSSALGKVFNYYKRNANRDGKVFELDREQFYNIIIQNCHYCGDLPNQSTKHSHHKFSPAIQYTGIDRKDNSMGYLLKNCLPCCTTCNKAKATMPYDQFKRWIQRLIQFNERDK